MSDLCVFKSNEWLSDNINIMKRDIEGEHIMHKHEFIELVYIAEGQGKQYINNAEYSVQKGDIVFVNYNQTHAFDGDMVFYNILLKPEFMSDSLIDTENIYGIFALFVFDEFDADLEELGQVVSFRGAEAEKIDNIVKIMNAEYGEKRRGYKSVLKGYMHVLFTEIIRKLHVEGQKTVAHYVKKVTPDILNYINENLSEKLSLKELAEKCFFSPTYFSRMFKQCYGKNFAVFVSEKRMEKAKDLLVETNCSIEEICKIVGYNDRSQFYKVFKKYTGYTPKNYREQKTPQNR